MKKKIIYILPGLFAVVFIILVLIGNVGPSRSCNEKKAFDTSAYTGVIKSKFLDKENHNNRTLIYSSRNKLLTIVLIDDTSGYYEYTKVGDTIYKSPNSEYIEVNRIKKFKIYFDCK